MGRQIIQQPDGRLAVLSSETDTIIAIDATRGEIAQWFAEEAAARAREDVGRVIDRVLDPACEKPYHQFTMSWPEAVAKHREHEDNRSDIRITFDDDLNPIWHD